MKKTDIWRWIERIISIAAILYLVIDNVTLRTTLKITLENVVKNDEKQNEYIQRQNEINGKFIILYDRFIPTGTGATEEETEGE
jgi:hypothetical protein